MTIQIIRDLTSTRLDSPTVATIGTFDGVHRGHQMLIKQLVEAAHKQQAQSAVVSFHPRPKTVLAPHLSKNDYLTTPEERAVFLERLGIDIFVLIPFTLEFAQTSARNFVELLVRSLNMVELWVGHDFALGKNREGNVEKLTALGKELNYQVQAVSASLVDGQIISSTRIRQLLLAGDIRQASELLGRYPSLTGVIGRGAQRGRTLGFPTANFIIASERLVPANGVYATYVRYPSHTHRYASVANIGVRPSFADQERTVEAYLFDFNDTLYGQELTLEFVERLRPEKKFDNVNELIAQINQDVEDARALLNKEVPPHGL